MVPTRHRVSAELRARYGGRADRLAPFLLEGDPLADAAVEALAGRAKAERDALVDRALADGVASVPDAPPALAAFFAHVDRVPFWFDEARANRGGAAFLRSGPLGGLVLGLRSLVAGYCSPAGNKPLVFSGRLTTDVARRLTETSRFVQVVALENGMRRDAEGFRATVKVRLMHAQVRRALARSPKWRAEDWGVPINQFDMAATGLLFSFALGEGLEQLGFKMTGEEREDLLHLWRYVAYVMGVREELLTATWREARELFEMIEETQDEPDDDGRALARSLIENALDAAKTPAEVARAKRFVGFAYGLSRFLIGDWYADRLGFPRTRWRFAIPAIRAVVAGADQVRRRMPFGDRVALDAGLRYWQDVVLAEAADDPVTFPLPDAVRGA